MDVTAYMEQHGHEQLSVYTDTSAGLRAYIAIHDTTLGPSLGGVRVWPHPTEDEALMDVLRLSRAMTYKSAAAGLHFGGGKGLIVADSRNDKTEAMMRAFGRFVDTLGGRYLTTEDVGASLLDLEWIAEETSHVMGLPVSRGGSGETSEMTGWGVYRGLQACAEEVWGNKSLSGKTIALQGFGHTATFLANHLLEREEGVKFIVADLNEDALNRARELLGATIVSPNDIYDIECDILSPCALGGVLNRETIPRLKCKIVCGSANNQLLEDTDAATLQNREILYAPDYIVNAGGVINISFESDHGYSEEAALEKTARIYETMLQVIDIAKSQKTTTAKAADKLAEERVLSAKNIREIFR
ncbi:MAG: leucine dehydrogenase [SAR202 cluster bacterium Io17-Chloro-G3]|nr:MAG: leucine dehydrogenase [SAR202 cluster bacterium Io17-Chloro-G3]